MVNPTSQGFQPLNEREDGEASPSAANNNSSSSSSSSSKMKLLVPVGATVAAVLLITLAFAGLWMYQKPEEGSGWWPQHVEETCRDSHGASARRLFQAAETLDDDDVEAEAAAQESTEGSKVPLRGLLKPMIADDTIYKFPLFGEYYMPYFGSVDLASENRSFVEVAVLFFHGAGRNAKDYFCTVKDLVEEFTFENQTAIEKYVILAPKYHYKIDFHHNSSNLDLDLWWNGSKPWGDWRSGAAADDQSSPRYNSFEVLDEMLLELSDANKFPNLKRIVLAGHSAGGVLVQRYALVSHLRPPDLSTDETLREMKSVRQGIEVRYVIANPSTFAYLDNHRWDYGWDAEKREWTEMIYKEYHPDLGRRNWNADRGGRRRRHTGLAEDYTPWGPLSPDLEPRTHDHPFICKTFEYRAWPFGLNWEDTEFGNLVPYIQQHPHLHRATEFYASRHIVYLTGQNDTCTDDMLGKDEHGNAICSDSCWTRGERKQCFRTLMDVRCPAMLEGPNRHRRAQNFMLHLQHHFGKKVHKLLEVPNAGHDAQAIYGSEMGKQVLFGDDLPPEPE